MKLIKWIKGTDIRLLNSLPVVIGMMLLIIVGVINKVIPTHPVHFPLNHLTLVLMFIIISFGGLASIIKKEFMWSLDIIIKGKWAVIFGYLWIIVSFLIVLFELVWMFRK